MNKVKVNCDLLVDEKTAEILQELLTDYGKTVLLANNLSKKICFYFPDSNDSYRIDIPVENEYGAVQTTINNIEVNDELRI